MRFHPHDVPLLQLQFRGVFDCDDAFLVGYITGEHVEKRGLARARPARDHHIQACGHCGLQQAEHGRSHSLLREKVSIGDGSVAKTPNGKVRTVNGQGGDDHIDARSIRESGVHHPRRFGPSAACRINYRQVVRAGQELTNIVILAVCRRMSRRVFLLELRLSV